MKMFILALGLVMITGIVSVESSFAKQEKIDKDCVISFCQGIIACDPEFSNPDVAADYLEMMESFCDD